MTGHGSTETGYVASGVVEDELDLLMKGLESCFELTKLSRNHTLHRQIARTKIREAIMWLRLELEEFHRDEWYDVPDRGVDSDEPKSEGVKL